MKKVRVLRNMPSMKMGEIFNLPSKMLGNINEEKSLHYYPETEGKSIGVVFDTPELDLMIADKWVELVEEDKNLVTQFKDFLINSDHFGNGYKAKIMAEMACDHTLKVFDKETKGGCVAMDAEGIIMLYKTIRKILSNIK